MQQLYVPSNTNKRYLLCKISCARDISHHDFCKMVFLVHQMHWSFIVNLLTYGTCYFVLLLVLFSVCGLHLSPIYYFSKYFNLKQIKVSKDAQGCNALMESFIRFIVVLRTSLCFFILSCFLFYRCFDVGNKPISYLS